MSDSISPEIVRSQVLTVTVSVTQKINLGNYQSRDYFVSSTAQILEGQDSREVQECLKVDCQEKVKQWTEETLASMAGENRTAKKEVPNY